MSEEIQAFVDVDPVEVERIPEVGPAPRSARLVEGKRLAFFRIDLEGKARPEWRVATCEKHAIDAVFYSHNSPVRAIRIRRFNTKAELIAALPPGRSVRSVFPHADLKLAYKAGLLDKRDTTP